MSERQVSRILVARDETRLNTLAARLRAETSRSVDILPTDLAAPSDLLRVEHRPRQDPTIGMLVNNAMQEKLILTGARSFQLSRLRAWEQCPLRVQKLWGRSGKGLAPLS